MELHLAGVFFLKTAKSGAPTIFLGKDLLYPQEAQIRTTIDIIFCVSTESFSSMSINAY